jgi:clan AA aspartic protease
MTGHVDSGGRALITVAIRPSDAAAPHEVELWIDTGFTGDLVLPQSQIDDLGLAESGTVGAILADGSDKVLKRYVCRIEWFGEERDLEVVANAGEYPLLGVGLLIEHDLVVSYRTGDIQIV